MSPDGVSFAAQQGHYYPGESVMELPNVRTLPGLTNAPGLSRTTASITSRKSQPSRKASKRKSSKRQKGLENGQYSESTAVSFQFGTNNESFRRGPGSIRQSSVNYGAAPTATLDPGLDSRLNRAVSRRGEHVTSTYIYAAGRVANSGITDSGSLALATPPQISHLSASSIQAASTPATDRWSAADGEEDEFEVTAAQLQAKLRLVEQLSADTAPAMQINVSDHDEATSVGVRLDQSDVYLAGNDLVNTQLRPASATSLESLRELANTGVGDLPSVDASRDFTSN